MSVVDISQADERNAVLTLKLKAKSGYHAEAKYDVSANQWGEILAICERNPAAISLATNTTGENV